MWPTLAIAVALAIATTTLLILSPHLTARLFGPRCPSCGRRPIEPIEDHVWHDPAPNWELYRCDHCREDFVRTSSGFVPRTSWNGDPEGEHSFLKIEISDES